MLIYSQRRQDYVYEQVAKKVVAYLVRKHQADLPKLWILPSDFIAQEVIATGLYEKSMLLALRNVMGAEGIVPGVALDVGANIGNHTVSLAQLFERVIAFEPNPAVLDILRANVAGNACANVTVVDKGLGDAAGRFRFANNQDGNSGNSHFVAGDSSATPEPATHELPIVLGDDVLREMRIGASIRLIKVDVEGYELQALRGLREHIRRDHPVIVFESQSRDRGSSVLAFLRDLSYQHFYALERQMASTRANALLKLFRRSWLGADLHLNELDHVEDRFYPSIVASPEPLRPRG